MRNDDNVTLKADDEGDCVNIMFENESQDRISDFEMKLMDIDSEHLGIPDTEYKCTVKMPSAEFQRICRDLSVLGDTWDWDGSTWSHSRRPCGSCRC